MRGLLFPAQDVQRRTPKCLARRREPHGAAIPQQERQPEFRFQVEHRLADGWLGDVETAGGFRVVEVLGHGGEVAQVT